MSGNFPSSPGTVADRPANKAHAGYMLRHHAGDATHATFATVQVAGHSDLCVAPATASVAGALAAADKAKIDAATSANTASAIVQRDAGGNVSVTNIVTTYLNGLSLAPAVDANGWQITSDASGKLHYRKQAQVTAGIPANPVWANIVAFNLPTGMTDLTNVYVQWSWRADAWARTLIVGYDGVDASTGITFHGTVYDGANWSARVARITFDVELVQK